MDVATELKIVKQQLAHAVDCLEVIAIKPADPNDGIDHEKMARVCAEKTLKVIRETSND